MLNASQYVTVASIVLGLGACSSGSRPPASPRPLVLPVEQLEGPYVAARAEFVVTLDEPVAMHSGTLFRAHLDQPVRSPENEIVLATGATIHGEVVAVQTTPRPSAELKFDDVETRWGPARLSAVIAAADPLASPVIVTGDRPPGPHVPFTGTGHRSAAVTQLDARAAVGGGPPPEDQGGGGDLLPRGAKLRLMLVEPLVPPHPRSPAR